MTLQEKKLMIIERIIHSSDKSMLKEIEKVIASSGDFWDELSEEQIASIDRGIKQLNAGKGIPHSKVKKKYAKWLR